MKISATTRLSRRIRAILFSAVLTFSLRTLAADEKDIARAEWMTGYVKLESGDKAVAGNNVVVATGLYKEALDIFIHVQRKYPNWNPTLLKYRIAYCQQQIDKLEAKYQSDTSVLSKEDLIALTARQAEENRHLTTSLDELKKRVGTMSESLGNMQAAAQKSAAFEAAVTTLSAEKKALEDQAVRLNLRLKEALAQVATLSDGAELLAKLNRAEEALRAAQQDHHELKTTTDQQANTIAASKAQISTLTKQLNEARAGLDAMNTAAKANQEILDAQADTINKQQIQLTALEAKQALAEKTSREQAQATSALQQEKAAMAAEVTALRQFKERITAEREAEKQLATTNANTTQTELQTLRGDVAALKTQLAEAKAQAQQLVSKQQLLEGDRAKVITLEEARMNLLSELERTKNRLTQAEAQNLKLVADVNALTIHQRSSAQEQKNDTNHAQLDNLRQEMAAQAQQLLAQTALTTRQENVIAEMTKVITENEKIKKAQEHQLAELKDKFAQLAATRKTLEPAADNQQNDTRTPLANKPDVTPMATNRQTEQETQTPTQLEKEIATYQAKLAAAADAAKKARAERDELEKKLQNEIAQRIQQEGAIAGMLQQRRIQDNELAKASNPQTDISTLQQQLRELSSEKQLREQELSALRQAREQHNLQLSMAQQQVAKLEDALRMEKMKAAFPGQPAVTNNPTSPTAASSTALQDEVKTLHQRLQDKDKQLLDQDKQLMAKERDLMAKNQLLQAMAGSEQEKVAWMKQLDELGKRAQQEQQQRLELEKALANKEKQRAKDLADMENKLIQVTAELTRLEQERLENDAKLIHQETERATKEREQQIAINQALRQGLAAERAGKTKSARDFYNQVLEKQPDNTMALQRLGIIAASTGDDSETIKYLEQSFKQNPDDPDTLIALGTAMVRQSKPELAISMLSRAVAIDNKNASAVRAYGMALLSAGWRDAAESQLKRAVTLQPKDGDAAYNLAVLMATSQPPRLDEARQWYQKALQAGAQPDPGMDALLKK